MSDRREERYAGGWRCEYCHATAQLRRDLVHVDGCRQRFENYEVPVEAPDEPSPASSPAREERDARCPSRSPSFDFPCTLPAGHGGLHENTNGPSLKWDPEPEPAVKLAISYRRGPSPSRSYFVRVCATCGEQYDTALDMVCDHADTGRLNRVEAVPREALEEAERARSRAKEAELVARATLRSKMDDLDASLARAEEAERERDKIAQQKRDLATTALAVKAQRDEARASLTAAREENARLKAPLADLVRLKDGPRDDAYRAEKDDAWDRAREALPDNRPGVDVMPGPEPDQAPERYDLWVCKDCRQPAHTTGDRCSRDRRRTWTQMDTVKYVRADLYQELKDKLKIAQFDANVARGECDMAVAAATMDLRKELEQAKQSVYDCPNAEVCQTCPCADEDDICFPGERRLADLAEAIERRDEAIEAAGQAMLDALSWIDPVSGREFLNERRYKRFVAALEKLKE